MTIITDERCTEYAAPGHPERPARIRGTLERLRAQSELTLHWAAPRAVTEEQLTRAHHREHVAAVREATADFDADSPAYPLIYDHAVRSVGGALQALKLARAAEPAFSLMRPPGHHATADRAMGFCYFNSIAVAALEAAAIGTPRVAVFDFDVHHGNGTEAILCDRPGVRFCSVHQHPCYPGSGPADAGNNCFNFPVAPHTPRTAWREVLTLALDRVREFQPDIIGVSAGFDAYARDPLAQGTLEVEDFFWLGESLRKMNVPFFSVLEGGYSSDLPELILAYLKGASGR